MLQGKWCLQGSRDRSKRGIVYNLPSHSTVDDRANSSFVDRVPCSMWMSSLTGQMGNTKVVDGVKELWKR